MVCSSPAGRQAALPTQAVNIALGGEQGLDALDGLEGNRRDRLGSFATSGIARDIGQFEELPARMGKAERGRCRHLPPRPVEQRIEAVVAISLKDAAEVGQMPLRVLAAPIAGGIEDRSRRRRPGERLIVAHVNPYSPGRALALRQDRDRRVVAMKPLSLEHMRLDQVEERPEGNGDVSDLIGERLGRQVDALAFEPKVLGADEI